MLFRQRRINRVEGRVVISTEIARRIHAGKQDLDVACLQTLDELVEILIDDRGRNSPKRIVGAKFKNYRLGVRRYRPLKPRECRRGCVARDARIDDCDVIAFLPQGGSKPAGKSVLWG